jgi:hypothetical protein
MTQYSSDSINFVSRLVRVFLIQFTFCVCLGLWFKHIEREFSKYGKPGSRACERSGSEQKCRYTLHQFIELLLTAPLPLVSFLSQYYYVGMMPLIAPFRLPGIKARFAPFSAPLTCSAWFWFPVQISCSN